MEGKKRQHYVPQFYLRQFTAADGKVAVYDKQDRRIFRANPTNIAVEARFYDFDGYDFDGQEIKGEDRQFFENSLSEMESQYATIMDRFCETIVKSRRFDGGQKRILSLFITIQYLRTAEYRQVDTQLRSAILQVLNQELQSRGLRLEYGYDDEAKMHFLSMFDPEKLSAIMGNMLNKIWMVWKNRTQQPFYASDNPVALISEFEESAGFATRGTEVLLPINPIYLLDICDSQHFTDRVRFDCKVVNLRDLNLVQRYNTAQVRGCTRQVYSSTDTFDLARRIVGEDRTLGDTDRARVEIEQLGESITKFSKK
jgi:hypothetical protein